jgi:glycosyltransferase involved in cell wall biosynthesis
MRILFHHRIASRDGQSVHLEELMAALKARGHDILLVGPKSFASAGFGSSNSVVDAIKRMVPAWLYELLEIAYNIKASSRLWAAVRDYRPDVIYERFSLFLFAGIWVRRLTGRPLLMEVNAPLYEERVRNDGLRLNRIGHMAQRALWRRADHLFPVTKVLARTIENYGVPSDRITVIPNGIDPIRFPAVRREPRPDGRIVLGFTGFVRSWNAADRLIEFAARHHQDHDIEVLIVGDGPARPSLEDAARQKGVADRVRFTGLVGRDAVMRHVASFDIAVIPGLTPYSSPLKLFEYLQLGCAIVAPDMENIREVLTDGQDALLFSPDLPGAMEAAILKLCASAELRQRLGQSGQHTITRKSLTWTHNAERVAAVATALLNRQHAQGGAAESGGPCAD